MRLKKKESLLGRIFARLEACYLLVAVCIFLFLFDQLRQKHPSNTRINKTREDCCDMIDRQHIVSRESALVQLLEPRDVQTQQTTMDGG